MIKKYLMIVTIAVAVFLFHLPQAHGSLLLPVQYTGITAERIDDGKYYGGSNGGYIGGPLSNHSLGGAYQFEIFQPLDIDYMLVNARVLNNSSTEREAIQFDFKLYSGTLAETYGLVPDIQSLRTQSPMDVETKQNQYGFYDITEYQDVKVPFVASLEPGTYWLARERDFGETGPKVDNIGSLFYGSEAQARSRTRLALGGQDLGTITTPEPATAGMLAFGLPLLWRRKGNAKGS